MNVDLTTFYANIAKYFLKEFSWKNFQEPSSKNNIIRRLHTYILRK